MMPTYRALLAALSLAAAASAQCIPGVDHPGSDLPSAPLLGVRDAPTCGLLCNADPLCTVYVFIAPRCQPGGAQNASLCYLKTGAPRAAPQLPCYCSGNATRAPPPPAPPPPGAVLFSLDNGLVAAALGARGLVRLAAGGVAAGVGADEWALVVDGQLVNSSLLPDPAAAQAAPGGDVVYTYAPTGAAPAYAVTVTYAAPPGAAHVRKTLTVASSTPGAALELALVAPFDTLYLVLGAPLVGAAYATGALGTYGVFLRAADGTGAVAAAENPFLAPTAAGAFAPAGALVRVAYAPGLVWNQTTAADATPRAFVADAALLALYTLSPNAVPPAIERDATARRFRATAPYLGARAAEATDTFAGSLVEYAALGAAALPAGVHAGPASWLNYAERDAFRALGEAAFAAAHFGGAAPLRVHIPWTENDYQIDIANATQWPEYERILQTLSRIGVDRVLFAGGNSDVSTVADCEDDWCWENVLWLGYGERLREGSWAPGAPVAPSVARLISTAASLGVSAIPYVYPILGFTANRSTPAPWLSKDGNKLYSALSNREFQDYFIATTVNFSRATGSYGAGYDYTYFWYGGATQYAQWHGWRRTLLGVRAQVGAPGLPQYVVDNRQASHDWSPWMWAAGSYAEPLQSDEQTTSWTAYVQDIHIDRTDGNRQREMNYDYAQSKLCQPSALPGFFHHNTDRGDGRRSDLSIRDYDFYGAPYTILSAIATGGLNAVVCDVPARDAGEFAAFPAAASDARTASVAFYRAWFQFATDHADHLRNTKFLPAPPGPGVIDGTYAMRDGAGFLFLFNPNAEAAETPAGLLQASAASLDVACAPGEGVTIGELWPFPAPALLTVPCGANFSLPLDGRSARVLTVAPAAPGDAAAAAAAAAARAAPLFRHNQPVAGMAHDAAFAGGALAGTVRVPAAVFAQLAARAADYPVPWTAEDAGIAWLNPARLLVSIDVNRALTSAAVITATLAGAAVPVVPVWSCRNVKQERCFQGFFVDLTAAGVAADTDVPFVVTLPSMPAGAFGGVYYDNVDTIFT